MANADIVKGFQPYGKVISANIYQAGGTIYEGDLVKLDSGGQVVQAAATDACLGVALAYAASGASVLVADSPAQKFIGQADDATIDAQTDLNLNYDIIVAAANTTYRRSGMEVDASTQSAVATLPLKVLRVLPAIANALGANVDVIVKINNHQLGSHTGTAGV